MKSPEQERAETAPPKSSVLTAAVQRRVLVSTVVTRGTVDAANKVEVTPIVNGVSTQVITAIPAKLGSQIDAGRVIVAVSGRPLFVFHGKIPAYRDLKPADTGKDVHQLQQALSELGKYGGGDEAGYFGPATKSAVRQLYNDAGYDAPNTGGPGGIDDQASLNAAEDAVDTAEQDVAAIRRRIAAGEKASVDEESFSKQLARAEIKLTRAQHGRTALLARTGTMLPAGEFVFVPDFPVRLVAITGKIGNTVKAPLVTLASGDLRGTVKLRPDQVQSVRVGMSVKLDAETLGEQVDGKVTQVGVVTPDPNGGPAFVPATVTPAKALPVQWAGLDVRVSIISAKTEQRVLVVPLSAISAGADGKTTVSVSDKTGTNRRVEVKAGASGDGFVAVTPIGGELSEDDLVVVGGAS
ncbi:peptidoglycan-binding protein [Actinoplanes sp. NPDC051411]|uniref:peptidoglycan-binding protein n=1 Tax=Actinoplanes sp. NPDC051411 TaxID=3155522 RepID=UPI0034357A7D